MRSVSSLFLQAGDTHVLRLSLLSKPFLEALRGLSKLKRADLTSGTDTDNPFILTTARVFNLLQNHWPAMEDLAIAHLRTAEDGPAREEDDMWDHEFQDSDEDEAGDEDEDDEEEGDETEKAEGAEKEEDPNALAIQAKDKVEPKGLKKLRLTDPGK